MTQSTQDTDVRIEITVEAPIEKAFGVFTERIDTWWPRGYHIGATDMAEAVVEPRVGGRWYERSVDGSECGWGEVLAWDPPNHVALSWALSPAWQQVDHPEQASRIDVRFTADGSNTTTVTLVHSGLSRHGKGWESMRDTVAGPSGWGAILDGYAKTAAVA
jgi:uncharacterized protein YndB with AHSA1/START domain